LQLRELEACVTATGTQDPPPPEWLLIRDARLLLNAGHVRRAVFDAGTAAELAMTALIDKYLGEADTQEAVRKAIAGGFSNLGAKNALLKILLPGLLPERVQPDLIEKRNTAGHGGGQITVEEAMRAIEIATEIIESAHPLDRLLPIQISEESAG
jgi:hypothetical protein